MKKFTAAFIIIIFLITSNGFAQNLGVISLGADLKKEEKEVIFKVLSIKDKIPEVVVANDEEKKYLSGFVPESRMSSKAVVCAFVNTLPENEGIRVSASNITYVTPEMITECMITAGLKDSSVKIAVPYNVSGSTSLTGIIKAYEKLTGTAVSESAKEAASLEIAVMGDLGQKIGMQKSLQFINEIKKEVIKEAIVNNGELAKVVSHQESRFNIILNEVDRNKVLSLMDKVGKLGLKLDDVLLQQKNISSYVDDLSKTAVEKNMLQALVDSVLVFFKKVSLMFRKV